MSNNLFVINTIALMVVFYLFTQFNSFRNFKLAAQTLTMSNRLNSKLNKQGGFVMMNSNLGRGKTVLLQKERGNLYSVRIGSDGYSVFLYTGKDADVSKRGNKYLLPVDELKVLASKISFIEKCNMISGFKVANDWMNESFSVDKMASLFWKSQKTGYAGLVGTNVNDSTTIFDILFGLYVLGGYTTSQIADIFRLALGFKGNEGKGKASYKAFDRAKVTIDGVKETMIVITPKAYNTFITSLKVCSIEDNLDQIMFDARFVFSYTSEKIIDSPKRDIGIDPTLLKVNGVESSRQISMTPDFSEKVLKAIPTVKTLAKMVTIDSPQIRATKMLSDYACERINAINSMSYTDDLINIDKLEEVALIHADKLDDVVSAKFVYSVFRTGFNIDITAIEEDDDCSMAIITEERMELENRIAQFMRTMFKGNVPAMIYLAFYASYMNKRTDKAINKDNINNFPFVLREEMITFVNGGKVVECYEKIMINKYTEDDNGTLRLIVDGVDVINGSMLSDRTLNTVAEYDYDRNMLIHYVTIEIPTYDANEVIFFIKHAYEDDVINEGDIIGIGTVREGKKTNSEIYNIDGEPLACELQHQVKGYYFTKHLNGMVGVVTNVTTSQPWEKNDEELCYSVITVAIDAANDSDEQDDEQEVAQPTPSAPESFKPVVNNQVDNLDDLDDLSLIKHMGFNLKSE